MVTDMKVKKGILWDMVEESIFIMMDLTISETGSKEKWKVMVSSLMQMETLFTKETGKMIIIKAKDA